MTKDTLDLPTNISSHEDNDWFDLRMATRILVPKPEYMMLFRAAMFLILFSGSVSSQELLSIEGMPGQGLDMAFTLRHGPVDEGYQIEILAFTAAFNPKADWNRVQVGETFTIDFEVFARENCEKCRAFFQEPISVGIPFATDGISRLEEPVEVLIPWAVYNDADEFGLTVIGSNNIAFLFSEKITK